MSRRRPSAYSHGNSARSDRSLSVTRASLEDFHLNETTNEPYLAAPSPYAPPTQGAQPSSQSRPRLEPSYLQAPYNSDSNPSYPNLQPYPAYQAPLEGPGTYSYLGDDTSFSSRQSAFNASPLGNTGTMSYPYSHDIPSPADYRGAGGYSGPSSAHGYSNPGTEPSLSRSMSGPPSLMLPTSILPSSTYGEFREAGREVSRQRRRNVAQVRREHKARTRRVGMLPSIPGVSGSSQAEILSGPINSLTAHSSSSYGGRSPYPQNPSPILQGGAFIGTSSYASYPTTYTTASPYAPTYSNALGPSSAYSQHRPSRDPSTLHTDPVVIDQPKKPRCWEHGCNGRAFSTFSNLLRHQREKSGNSTKSVCNRCGAEFTRKTARDGHLAHDKCKAGRRDRD